MNDSLWIAYSRAVIRFQADDRLIIAGIGSIESLPFPEPCHVITAWNPFSQKLTLEENRHRNERLLARLQEKTADIIETYSSAPNGDWREDGFLVHGIGRETLCLLATEFEQNAIYELTTTKKIVLSVHLLCMDERDTDM